MTNFFKRALQKGHETQFLINFCMNFQQKYLWCIAKKLLTKKFVTNEKRLEDTILGHRYSRISHLKQTMESTYSGSLI